MARKGNAAVDPVLQVRYYCVVLIEVSLIMNIEQDRQGMMGMVASAAIASRRNSPGYSLEKSEWTVRGRDKIHA